jgi:hypothetical protein
VTEVNACVEEIFWCGIHTVFKAQRTTLGETMFLLVVCGGCWSEIPHFSNSYEKESAQGYQPPDLKQA